MPAAELLDADVGGGGTGRLGLYGNGAVTGAVAKGGIACPVDSTLLVRALASAANCAPCILVAASCQASGILSVCVCGAGWPKAGCDWASTCPIWEAGLCADRSSHPELDIELPNSVDPRGPFPSAALPS